MERCFQPQNALSALFYWAQRLSIVAVTIIGELLIYTQARGGAGREQAFSRAVASLRSSRSELTSAIRPVNNRTRRAAGRCRP